MAREKGQGQGNTCGGDHLTAFVKCRLRIVQIQGVERHFGDNDPGGNLVRTQSGQVISEKVASKRFNLRPRSGSCESNLVLVKGEISWRWRQRESEVRPFQAVTRGRRRRSRPKRGRCHIRRPVSTTPSRQSWLQEAE